MANNDAREKLLQFFSNLPDVEQKTLLDFAEFLQVRSPQREPVVSEPLNLPRPENESVVAAIKRLNQNYPMIERNLLLSETSDLMMQHILRGRAALEIINELEAVFDRRFQEFVQRTSSDN